MGVPAPNMKPFARPEPAGTRRREEEKPMARYLPVQKDAATSTVSELYNQIERDGDGTIPNLFKTLAPSASFLNALWGAYRGLVQGPCELNERARALALLKAAKVHKDNYGTAQFTELAKRQGVTEDQVKAIDAHDRSELFTDAEKMLMSHAEMVAKDPGLISGDFFKFLKNHYTQQQVTELTALAAFATLMHRFCKALDVDVDKR